MLCDYHVHTIYSDDSVYKMEDVIKDGIKKGINELCFTDHVDYEAKNLFEICNIRYKRSQLEKNWVQSQSQTAFAEKKLGIIFDTENPLLGIIFDTGKIWKEFLRYV